MTSYLFLFLKWQCSLEPLSAYNDQTIEIMLPGDLTVHDIDWLSIYCIEYSVDFGNVMIPDLQDENIPPFIPLNLLPVCYIQDLCYTSINRLK